VTELTNTVALLTVTENAVVAAVVALRASSKVKVKVVPALLTADELYPGAVISAFELFVTVFVVAVNETASLPAES
jgi:hypothetical protein